ncbi:hypothetical protein ACN47E_004469 [Coniothyrium glycines]
MGGRSRVKRKTVQSDDGWSVITHGLSHVSLKDEKKDAGAMPDIVQGLNVDRLLKDMKNRQERWTGTACAKQIDEVLQSKVIKGNEPKIQNACCIGIGSFSRDWEHRHRSLWQLILFIRAVEILKEQGFETLMYTQEPAFTELDRELLRTLNINVTGQIEEHITSDSFVFSPFVDWYLLLPTFLKGKQPYLYIGNEILDDYSTYARSDDKKKRLEECNQLGREFLKSRKMVKMVDFDLHAHALNGMVIYWDKPTTIEDEATDIPN